MMYLLITYYSLINGIDPTLAFKMAKVESNMNPAAISSTGDGGLFQLNKRYYKFHNEDWRYRISHNTALAMSTLGRLKRTCKHKLNNSYVLCYNMGVAGASKLKKPLSHQYYKKMNLLFVN